MPSHSNNTHKNVEFNDSHGGRHGRKPSTDPFAGQWAIWFIAIPIVGTLLWWLGESFTWCVSLPDATECKATVPLAPDHPEVRSVGIGMVFLVALGLSLLAAGVGRDVAGRKPIITAHAAATPWLVAICIWITASIGWSLMWAVVHTCLSAFGAFGWNIYNIKAFRADPRVQAEVETDDGLREALGLTKHEVASAEPTPFGAKIDFKALPGGKRNDIVQALPGIDAHVGAINGMSYITKGTNASHTVVNLVTSDPWKDWLPWPGLLHPGGSFADNFSTAYYVTGIRSEYNFTASHDKNAPRQRQAIVRAGATGAGKSGDQTIEVGEALSRRDAVVVVAFPGKFRQNLAWCQQWLTLVADTNGKVRLLEDAIWRLVEYRASIMGGGDDDRDWGSDTYRKYGFAAVLFVYDEADKVLGKLAEDIATTALSVGVFMSVSLPDADHRSMPVKVRRSLGIRKCFGTGDKYTDGMILLEETRETAPKPFEIGTDIPCWHLMDRVNGVDKALWSVPQRSYFATHAQLAAAVEEARQGFPAPQFTAAEVAIFGDAWTMCQPSEATGSRSVPGDVNGDVPDAGVPAPADFEGAMATVLADLHERGEAVTPDSIRGAAARLLRPPPGPQASPDTPGAGAAPTLPFSPDPNSPNTEEEDVEIDIPDSERVKVVIRPLTKGSYTTPEQRAEISKNDRKGKVVRRSRIDVDFNDGVPAPDSQESADQEIDRVVLEMVAEGITEFGNTEILRRCRLWSDSMMARRLRAVADDQKPDMVFPPGIKLMKVRHGWWRMVYEQRQPATQGSRKKA